MAKPCDFCGKNVSDMNAYFRPVNNGNAKVRICGDCEFQFTGLMITTNEKKTENSVKWAKEILSNGKYKPEIYSDFCEQLNTVEKKLNSEQAVSNVSADNVQNNAATVQQNNIVPPAQQQRIRYSRTTINDSSVWTEVLKIIAYISVVLMTVGGAIIGGMLADGGGIFLGLLFGFAIGAISMSSLMVFVNMAEDTKATREYVRQIRNMMDEDRDDK